MKNILILAIITVSLLSVARPITATGLCLNTPSPAIGPIISAFRITQHGGHYPTDRRAILYFVALAFQTRFSQERNKINLNHPIF